MDGDVVLRARFAVQRIDGRDMPFCVDCHDQEVGVDTELVAELVSEVERLRSDVAAYQTRQVMLRDTLDEVRRACEDALP